MSSNFQIIKCMRKDSMAAFLKEITLCCQQDACSKCPLMYVNHKGEELCDIETWLGKPFDGDSRKRFEELGIFKQNPHIRKQGDH